MTAAPSRRDGLAVAAIALAARLAVVAWAHSRFPPAEDGHYYDVLARRIASGAGYTWLWPDGTVTPVALYPVGYPALLALAYRLLGPAPVTGMLLNALLGAAGAYAAWRMTAGAGPFWPRWRPFAAGLTVALHPALLAYTPAFMTEGVTASLLLVAGALAAVARGARAPRAWAAAAGAVVGAATLVRPASVLLAPVVGGLAAPAGRHTRLWLLGAALASATALGMVAPWTARNCVRMHRCALVSFNGGWNLLIGVQARDGAYAPLEVPPECAAVWDEGAKDRCFERVAEREIARAPLAWVAAAPAKLAMTFDSIGAGGWYLHTSNAAAFDDRAKSSLAVVETLACRLLLLIALVVAGRAAGAVPLVRKTVALIGSAGAVTLHAWVGYVALAACVALLGRRALAAAPVGVPLGGAVLAATALVHAAFFGAGRYGLLTLPFVALCAFGQRWGGARGRACAAAPVGADSVASTPLG